MHWICGSYHELYTHNVIIVDLMYKSFRGHGLKMKESIVVRGLIKIGLLHAPVNHPQEIVEITRGSVTEHRLCVIPCTNFILRFCPVSAFNGKRTVLCLLS